MIVQACLNGARPPGCHPALPLTLAAMVRDGLRCVAAGAAELHLHPRDTAGRESLAAVSGLMPALRRACPGTLIGVSTGDWIEADAEATRRCIAGWTALPDHASVNLAEPDAPAVIALLGRMGVGVEAGLATVGDARRLAALGQGNRMLRILIEIAEQQPDAAARMAEDIAGVLAGAGIARPVLLHGANATVWPLVRLARRRLWSTRVGLEDGCRLPDGTVAPDNAALVAAAVALFRQPVR